MRFLNFILPTAIFLSAFLLFQIQPIIAKWLLPKFGGSSSTWITCMLIFQGLLLVGYLYAHRISQLSEPKRQAQIHGLLMFLALTQAALMPTLLNYSTAEPNTSFLLGLSERINAFSPSLGIALSILLILGFPYMLLASTNPLLQYWLNRTKGGEVSYRLFSLSNVGSLLALLSYPTLVEPYYPISKQVQIWTGFFLLLLLLIALIVFLIIAFQRERLSNGYESLIANLEASAAIDSGDENAPKPVLAWLLLAAAPAALLSATTEYLTRDIAPVPLLWIIPLVIYLVSFILCFESQKWYSRWIWIPLFIAAPMTLCWLTQFDLLNPTLNGVLLFLLFIFILFMCSHGELSRLRPRKNHMTFYYIFIALGGVLGSALVAVVAPTLLSVNFDLSLSICLTYFICVWVIAKDIAWRNFIFVPKAFAIGLLVLNGIGSSILFLAFENVYVLGAHRLARNFYGTLKVTDYRDEGTRNLTHGRTTHGQQMLDPIKRFAPTSYYGGGSGAETAIGLSRQRSGPSNVGVVGLGAGTLAAYGRPGDKYTFYEINPLILNMARTDFTFLSDSQAQVDVVMGDARLQLSKDNDRKFDLLFIDAFSGDSIPVHLLTQEAMGLYLDRLNDSGIVAVHISNRYLDLLPVLASFQHHFQLQGYVIDTKRDPDRQTDGATWVLLGRTSELFEGIEEINSLAFPLEPDSEFRMWTDDYSSLVSIFTKF